MTYVKNSIYYELNPDTEEYSMVLQYADKGDLNHYLKEFSNKLRLSEIIKIAMELAAGVRYLYNYKEGIIHSNLSWYPFLEAIKLQSLKVKDQDVDKYLNTSRMQEILGLVPTPRAPYNYISIYTKAWDPVPYNRPTIETICQTLSGI
ncbi:23207_t:CDS:2 [Gigaspora margarita]|uniref:23207_t:CDS:1 n=1 Tax=Gigaspora margarita TaxID=4874 RepID=A0ABN7VY43_GIGMA|nr:23207_t:CDS:2 [Gigaspora margarita]